MEHKHGHGPGQHHHEHGVDLKVKEGSEKKSVVIQARPDSGYKKAPKKSFSSHKMLERELKRAKEQGVIRSIQCIECDEEMEIFLTSIDKTLRHHEGTCKVCGKAQFQKSSIKGA